MRGSTARALAPSGCVVGKQCTPSQENLSFRGDDLLEDLHAKGMLGRVRRGEERADAVGAGLSQDDPQGLAALAQELMGDLDQEPRAVAGVVLAATGTAVIQIHQRPQSIANQLMRLSPFQIDDESHTATVVLETRIIETLGRR